MARNYFSGMSGGWVGGWIKWKYNQLSPQLGWAWAWQKYAILVSILVVYGLISVL